MKKFFFSFLAIAAIASCAKTEDFYTEGETEIKIAPVTSMATKANHLGVIDNTTYPAAENFDVFAYWKNEPAGSLFTRDTIAYLIATNETGVEFQKRGAFWGGTTTYYWPKNGSLRFAAYSPSSLNMTHKLETDTYTLTGLDYPETLADSYDILVAPTTESYTSQTAAEKVSVVFQHALSWITFKLVSTEVADADFTVTDVIVNDVNVHGDMVADMTAGTKKWDTSLPETISVYHSTTGLDVTTTPKIYEDTFADRDHGKNFLVLPQSTTTVTINFTQKEMDGTPALTDQTVTIPLTLDGNDPWEAGKHYTYTVIFDLDEILINPSVEDWEEVTVPTVEATATTVKNQSELQAALEAGRNVRLAEDINLTNSLTIGKSVITRAEAAPVNVTIDLNGKSIVAESTDAIVVTDGATLTINGDGKVWAATDDASSANAIWVKHGHVIINGGDYYVGADFDTNENKVVRNECIYVGSAAQKDNAASYVSSVVINGGTFSAKVMEDDQYWVLNLKDEFYAAGSTITVKGGTFKDFDPSNNKSEGVPTNFVADGFGSYELEAGYWTVASTKTPVQVKSVDALNDVALHGGVAVLAADLTLDNYVEVRKEMTVELNGKTITHPATSTATYPDVFEVYTNGNLTINGKGNVVAENGYCFYVTGDAKVTLNDGDYFSVVSVVDARKDAVVTINGGKFVVDGTNNPDGNYGQVYTLNVKDGSNAKIYAKGGTYYNFNPAESLSETPHANFVAEGYKSVKEGDWYTVMAE